MKSLDEIRKKINDIDIKILELFEQRLALMPDLIAVKSANRLPIHDPDREYRHLMELKSIASLDNRDAVEELFSCIMKLHKETQIRLNK